jgi:uncharacterized coiled-coil DUF342 family protein
MTTPVLPAPTWAQEITHRLSELPTLLGQRETIGRLVTAVRGLKEERDGLNRALEQTRAELHAARHEISELQQVIIKRLAEKMG